MRKTIFVLMIFVSFIGFCLAQEIQERCIGIEGARCGSITEIGIKPPRECDYTEQEVESLGEAAFNYLIVKNDTFTNYEFYNLTYMSCLESEEGDEDDRMYGATLEIKQTQDSPKGHMGFLTAIKVDGDFEVVFSETLYPYFDFEAFFTEKENEVLDFTLKVKVINEEEEDIWVVISQKYEEIGLKYEPNCDEFKQNFENIGFEKKYKERLENCWGYVKLKPSQAREIVGDWMGYMNYFGDELEYEYYGTINQENDVELIVSSLSDCLTSKFTNMYDMYYTPFSEEDIKKASCLVNYMDKRRIHASKHIYNDEKNIGVHLSGYLNENAQVRISIWNKNGVTDADKREAIAFADDFLKKYFGKTTSFEFVASSQVVSVGVEQAPAEEASQPPRESENTHAIAKAELVLDFINYEELEKLNKRKEATVTSYSGENEDFYIGEKYLQFMKKEPNEELDLTSLYSTITISETSLSAAEKLKEEDESSARSALSAKFSDFFGIDDSLWDLEVYYVSDQPIVFLEKTPGTPTPAVVSAQEQEAPSFFGFSSDEFAKEAGEFDVAGMPKGQDYIVFIIIMAAIGIIVFVAFILKKKLKK